MIWICLIPLCIKPWHSDNCFFLIIFFSLMRRHGVELFPCLLGGWKRIACPYPYLLEFRVSTRYKPGTRWSEGLAIAEDRQNMSRPWPRPKRLPTDAYHEKGKEKKLWCVCIHARHKMPSVTIFGDGVGPAAHEEKCSTYDLQRCQWWRE